jgi:uncharacterized protein YneF (UPF0154 family)
METMNECKTRGDKRKNILIAILVVIILLLGTCGGKYVSDLKKENLALQKENVDLMSTIIDDRNQLFRVLDTLKEKWNEIDGLRNDLDDRDKEIADLRSENQRLKNRQFSLDTISDDDTYYVQLVQRKGPSNLILERSREVLIINNEQPKDFLSLVPYRVTDELDKQLSIGVLSLQLVPKNSSNIDLFQPIKWDVQNTSFSDDFNITKDENKLVINTSYYETCVNKSYLMYKELSDGLLFVGLAGTAFNHNRLGNKGPFVNINYTNDPLKMYDFNQEQSYLAHKNLIDKRNNMIVMSSIVGTWVAKKILEKVWLDKKHLFSSRRVNKTYVFE